MGVEERFREELKTAMRGGDTLRRDVIRFALSALNYEEKAKLRPLEEEEKVAVLQRQAKQRRESIDEFKKGNRQDLVDKESAELRLLEEYLPALMDRDAITQHARQAIQDVGAAGPGDRGKVMGRLMPQLRGQADGNAVNEVVSELLEALAAG
jgi:uncharacterized protein YqeY